MDKGGKNGTLSHLDILAIGWLSVTSKRRRMAEGSEFCSGIRLPDGRDVRAYMGDVSTPAKGNLADNQFIICYTVQFIVDYVHSSQRCISL